jgi:hypothetical protein
LRNDFFSLFTSFESQQVSEVIAIVTEHFYLKRKFFTQNSRIIDLKIGIVGREKREAGKVNCNCPPQIPKKKNN